jgi:hypothetical protein
MFLGLPDPDPLPVVKGSFPFLIKELSGLKDSCLAFLATTQSSLDGPLWIVQVFWCSLLHPPPTTVWAFFLRLSPPPGRQCWPLLGPRPRPGCRRYCKYCGGSGSVGSACFLASRIHKSEVWFRIRSLPFSHKGAERTERFVSSFPSDNTVFQCSGAVFCTPPPPPHHCVGVFSPPLSSPPPSMLASSGPSGHLLTQGLGEVNQ